MDNWTQEGTLIVVVLVSTALVLLVSIVFGRESEEQSEQEGATDMREYFSPKTRQQKQRKQRGASGGTQAVIESLDAILDEAKATYPQYSSVEEFVRQSPGLVEKSTMVLGQQGQKYLSDAFSVNTAASLKSHQMAIECGLQVEKLVNDAKRLLQQKDVVKVVVSAMIADVREAQKLEDQAQAYILQREYAVLLAAFLNFISENEALALLTGAEKSTELKVVEAEFSGDGVPKDVAFSTNGRVKHE